MSKGHTIITFQGQWKEEIKEQLQKIKSEGSHYPQLEEELVRRRREELR
jgi:mitogen-activated protein kinase kinase kinase 13